MAITDAEGSGGGSIDKLALSSLLGKTMTCSVEILKWVDIVDYMRDRCLPIIGGQTQEPVQ